LLALGRRGRRVDDHPWCRRCRFDLFGLPSPTHCPECGAALSHQRAVRHGQRRRQPRVMLMGLLLLLGSIGYTGFAAWRITQAEDWIEHKPVWWLIRDLGSSDATIRDDSSDELNQRLWENALDAD